MKTEKIMVKLNFLEPILGSLPADPAVYSNFIANKASSPWQHDEEVETMDKKVDGDDTLDKRLTVFAQDDTGLFFYDYHVKGFLKEAANVMKDAVKIKNLRSKIDNYLFISPRRIYLKRPDGTAIIEEDDIFERPLRAQTMQGPRVSLSASERVNLPVTITFSVEILENEKNVDRDLVFKLLDYGRFKGLGQWRNGGWGRFEWVQQTEVN